MRLQGLASIPTSFRSCSRRPALTPESCWYAAQAGSIDKHLAAGSSPAWTPTPITGPWRQDSDLLDAAAALTDASIGAARSDPVLLVCTHGVHDVCCALRGRPVAATVASRWPELVWECSHIGGDRFASNVVVLPDGFYYGNLDPDSALATVDAHLAGVVRPEYLRGMARHLPPVQAAVIAAYQHYGPLGPSDVSVRATEHIGPHHGHGSETFVDLVVEPQQQLVRVHVLSVRRPEAQLTCRAVRATPATEYRVITSRPCDHSPLSASGQKRHPPGRISCRF